MKLLLLTPKGKWNEYTYKARQKYQTKIKNKLLITQRIEE